LRVRVPELPENGAEIFAKAEWTNPGGSVKDRPVLRMLLEADQGIYGGRYRPDLRDD
jgi:cysteine synthase